jgi:uncharacterized metal-binding protein
MDMIRHHHERMQLIPVELGISVTQRSHYALSDLGTPQKKRAVVAAIKKPIHSHESLPRSSHSLRRKYPPVWKTAMEPESDK